VHVANDYRLQEWNIPPRWLPGFVIPHFSAKRFVYDYLTITIKIRSIWTD